MKNKWNQKEILQSMQLADLNADNFVENALEFGLLDDEAKAAVTARHAELVAQKAAKVHNVRTLPPATLPNAFRDRLFGPPDAVPAVTTFGIPRPSPAVFLWKIGFALIWLNREKHTNVSLPH